MINSQNKSYQFFIAFWVFLGLSLNSYLVAGQEKPRNLVPTFGEERTDTPKAGDDLQADPFSPIGKDQSESPLLPQGNGGDALVVERLDVLNPASTGLLSNDGGGFGAQMWDGTASNLTNTLLYSLPAKTKSPQLLELTRRLLLTGALLPQNQNAARRYLDLRFEKLRNAGLNQDAADLFDRLQFDSTSNQQRKMSAEISLLLNQNDKACELAVRQVGQADSDVFWTKLDVFCQLLGDEYDKAELGVALLEEQGEKDPVFYNLFAKLAGDSSSLKIDILRLKPLHVAMMRQAKMSYDLSAAAMPSFEILEALILTPKLLGASGLQGAFEATEFNRANTIYLQEALVLASTEDAGDQETSVFKAYANLYGALIEANNQELKVSRLLALWDLALENGHFLVISSVTADALLSIIPADHGPGFNAIALKSLLLVGQAEKAVLWERVIRRAASQGNIAERLKARTEVAHLDVFMLISGANGIARWNSSSFPAWKKAMEGDPEQAVKTELLLSILEVLDLPVSDDDWQDLLSMGIIPETAKGSYGVERNLTAAATAGRLAETVSLSLLALGEEGPGAASITTLVSVLTSLKAVGLEDEARQLAIEALILKGF
ncbi:MAG: hypothetical protein V7750_02535 [Sneathiella sp.]